MSTLYHYCPTDSFVSILATRTIRLCALTLANDSKEGELIKDTMIHEARSKNLSGVALDGLTNALQSAYDFLYGLGFCMSEEGDLLSQWRGYADDGKGISLGFSSNYLEVLAATRRTKGETSFMLKQLIYDANRLYEAANENINGLKPFIEKGAFRSTISASTILTPMSAEDRQNIEHATRAAYDQILVSMSRMFEFKNPAFCEEREWRLVSFSWKQDPAKCTKFMAHGNKIVPYQEIYLESLNTPCLLSVVLGPKHETPIHIIEHMLESSGFTDVKVTKSAATYR